MASHLKSLPSVEKLSPLCIRILGGNPGKFTLQGTNTYLLGSGKGRILIDTGEGKPAWVESLKSVLRDEKATIDRVLISHWHNDHVGGLADVLGVAAEAIIHKNSPDEGQSDIRDGQVFTAEGVTLQAHHTPGHTTDHVVFTLAEEDAMFTADNVLGQGTAVFEDLGTYIESLTKMKRLFGGKAYPGHGPPIESGPLKINEYIEHRKEREEQVTRVLREVGHEKRKPLAAMDIVKVVYRDVSEDLHPAACAGVLQILHKLEAEGKVAEVDGVGWRLEDKPAL